MCPDGWPFEEVDLKKRPAFSKSSLHGIARVQTKHHNMNEWLVYRSRPMRMVRRGIVGLRARLGVRSLENASGRSDLGLPGVLLAIEICLRHLTVGI